MFSRPGYPLESITSVKLVVVCLQIKKEPISAKMELSARSVLTSVIVVLYGLLIVDTRVHHLG